MGNSLVPNGVVDGLHGFLSEIDITEIVGEERDEPDAVIDLFEPKFLACEDG